MEKFVSMLQVKNVTLSSTFYVIGHPLNCHQPGQQEPVFSLRDGPGDVVPGTGLNQDHLLRQLLQPSQRAHL